MIGTVLDKYEVLQKVGEGGMATVYLGRHTTLARDVAIKVLHPHLSNSQRNRKRFAREARAIEHLRHDNILEIFDYSGSDAMDCYIITEFVRGETLTELLERFGRLPSELTSLIGLHLAQALDYAHGRGVLHRDLKPDNVMIRNDGTVKLMDFGIARFLDETQVTLTGALVGSPAYMSPEQAEEEPLDHRSDLFALGTLLYQVVTGHLPFQGTNPSLILKKIIEGDRTSVNELCPTASPTLCDVIERLMAVDRDARYQRAADVVEALTASLTEVGIAVDEPKWGIDAFLADTDAYRKRLDEHLQLAVKERGTALLATGDHLQALRQFNRLLSMDENNPEVLALVQGLHQEPSEPPLEAEKRRVGRAGLVVVALAVLGAVWLWVVLGELPDAPVEETVPVEETLPVEATVTPPPPPESNGVAPAPTAEVAPVAAPPSPPAPSAVLPPMVKPQPVPPPPAGIETGKLKINANHPADVYVGGVRRGGTRGTDRVITLPVGAHDVVIKGAYLRDYNLKVEIAPGETIERTVELSTRQFRVTVDDQWSDDCKVMVNRATRGTLAQVGRTITIDHPDRRNEVVLECAGVSYPREFTYMTGDARFPPPPDQP